VKRYEDNNSTISSFLSGQVQLVATGNVVAAAIIAKNPPKKPETKFLIKDSPCFIGLNKGEKKLQDKVDAILAESKKDGSLNGIAKVAGPAAAGWPVKQPPQCRIAGPIPPGTGDAATRTRFQSKSTIAGQADNPAARSNLKAGQTRHHGLSIRFPFHPRLHRRLVKGVVTTTELTAIGGVLGVAVGIFGAWARTQGRAGSPIVSAYVELIRNTPFLVQLFFIFFGLPLNVHISEISAAILAMVINLGAYSTEIIRAGMQAIPRGQIEAAQSLAMSRVQIFRHVVLRPALQKIWPALSSRS
jgi:His/Glu/Gln/Arg/opine family amino acid ABC transporter permease subunit